MNYNVGTSSGALQQVLLGTKGSPRGRWKCEEVFISKPGLMSCEACGRKIRNVHRMKHSNRDGHLNVGVFCAMRMEGDQRAARQREYALRKSGLDALLFAIEREAA